MSTKKTIVTCAVTGASLTPSMSPNLPVSPAEIAAQSIDAVKAGASVLHLHARLPDGRPTNDTAIWSEFVPRLQQETPALINMSASLGKTAEERLEAVLALKPDIATVIVGSMNYGLFNKSKNQGVSEFSQAWETEAFGEKAYQIVTQNSFATIHRMIDMLVEHDIAMEFECYDVGHLYILDHHLSRKPNIKRPIILQFLTGILGGIPSDIDHLVHLKRTAERLFGDAVELFTHGTGTGNIKAATYGAMMGTHIRVGQEDNLFEKPGVPFKSNAHQVEKVIGILSELNIEIASPDEARKILGLA
ncbi:3-keto-5-aminohexanoate cleavage protein [Brucella tritici]|uniref:3-keto-5-aminohexanoate cleavage protein n=1 Tax=Brucella tritici TaxID=94626 RepID=A0A7V7VQM4_9HYPH|nr:3-keto-5-aminohexanoate cleavage protein [Brucella tritici]KAB2654851.1 3-keto-5-aminohexanoate cleavage protein [Brucella tritici]